MTKIYTPAISKLRLISERAGLEKELEKIRDRYANEQTPELAERVEKIADQIGGLDLKIMQIEDQFPDASDKN